MKSVLTVLFNVLTGSMALIFGVGLMSTTLEKSNFNTIKRFYLKEKLTGTKAFVISIFITALLQSSTAVSIITVGLVNGGIIDLETSLFIIYGANIGTTLTAQLISLDMTKYGAVILSVGAVFYILGKKNIGKVCMGFGFMFSGIQILHYSVAYIRQNESIFSIIKHYGENHYILFAIGIFLTAAVQSSSAVTGIAIVLYGHNIIPLKSAVSLILGDNIGTCVTVVVASAGSRINAKRAAFGHMIYNVLGGILAFLFLDPFINLVMMVNKIAAHKSTALIADAHTVFNCLSAALFIPFTKQYARLLEHIITNQKKG